MFGHQPSAGSPEGTCGLALLLGLVYGQGLYDGQEDVRPVWLSQAVLDCTCNNNDDNINNDNDNNNNNNSNNNNNNSDNK